MRYYVAEHEDAWQQIQVLGYTQWNDLLDPSGEWTYDRFQNRAFLERVLPQLDLPPAPETYVFEYGCGSGPAACFLAARGYEVDAVDLIPEAIEIARRMASDRGIHVDFSVANICELASRPVTTRYDVVLDSFCLQSVVTDQDRAAVFSAVRARMKPTGYYVVSTALRGSGRVDEPGFYYDEATGMYYREVLFGTKFDCVVTIDGRTYIPHRRHLTADALRAELALAGFEVLSLDGVDTADVVCRLGPTY